MKFIAKPFYQVSINDQLIKFNVNGVYVTDDKQLAKALYNVDAVSVVDAENAQTSVDPLKLKKDELKEYLSYQNIDYDDSMSKAELQELI